MGAFITNLHVRDSTAGEVAGVLREMDISRGWLAAADDSEWISVWEKQASLQDAGRIMMLAEELSARRQTAVIGFLLHDSDFLCYWLYDSGRMVDEYNSSPAYFGNEVPDETAYAADCETLARYCRPGTEVAALEEILAQWLQEDALAGRQPPYVFAEQRLDELAKHLGIPPMIAATDYGDIGRDVSAEELGAVWIGSDEEPSGEDFAGGDELAAEFSFPQSPLLQAAGAGDVQTIEQLVADGADVNEIPSPYEVTPVGMAAAHGHTAAIHTLVDLGADIHKTGPGGVTPLRMAVSSHQPGSVQALIDLGADATEHDPQLGTLLHVAAAVMAPPEVVRLLLQAGADPQQPNAQGQTPLEALRQQQAGLEQARPLVPNDVPALDTYLQRIEEIIGVLESHEP